MTKQNANVVAIAAVVLAVIALILQFVFAAGGHATRTLAAEIAWPVLLVVAIAAFVYGRSLKS